jgi:hypothetical protein
LAAHNPLPVNIVFQGHHEHVLVPHNGKQLEHCVEQHRTPIAQAQMLFDLPSHLMIKSAIDEVRQFVRNLFAAESLPREMSTHPLHHFERRHFCVSALMLNEQDSAVRGFLQSAVMENSGESLRH